MGLIFKIRSKKIEDSVLKDIVYLSELLSAKLSFDRNFFRLSSERFIKIVTLAKGYLVENDALIELRNPENYSQLFAYDQGKFGSGKEMAMIA